MDQVRLESRVGKVVKLQTIELPYWRLDFNCGPRDKRFANISMTADRTIRTEGVLYELSTRQMRMLDNYEGCPFFYQKLAFSLVDGRTMYAYASFNPDYIPLPKTRAQPEYIQYIINGCEQNGLTKTMKRLEFLKKRGLIMFP